MSSTHTMDWTGDTTADLIEFLAEYKRCEATSRHLANPAIDNYGELADEYAGYVAQITAELARRA